MGRVTVYAKRALMVWGTLSLVVVVAFYATIAYQLSVVGSTVDVDDQDVLFVSEWLGSNHDQVTLVHSYNASGSWSGDYSKALAVRVTDFEVASVADKPGVSRADELPPAIHRAVRFVTDFTEGRLPWLPEREQLLSGDYYVYPVRLVLQGEYPDSAHLLFIRPADNMIYYVAVKI